MVTSKVIPPGKKGEIKATLSTGKYRGQISKTIYIHSNDPDSPRVAIKLRATVLPEIKIYFFHGEKKEFPEVKGKYNLHTQFFDLSEPRNRRQLSRIESKYNDKGNKPPVIVIGEHILGEEEIKTEFEPLLEKYKLTGCEFPNIQAKEVYLAHFYRGEGDEEVFNKLSALEAEYSNLIVKNFNFGKRESKNLYNELCELYRVPKEKMHKFPIIFIGEEFLLKDEIIALDSLMEKYDLIGTKILWSEPKKETGPEIQTPPTQWGEQLNGENKIK